MDRRIIETDIEALSKTAKAKESKLERELKIAVRQYNQITRQNKALQTERNIYRATLTEIQALANQDKNYCNIAAMIYNKCSEVL